MFTNIENQGLYRAIPPGFLKERAKQLGLDHFPDLEILREKIAAFQDDLRILEIGVGEGRALEWLQQNFRSASIVGLEACEKQIENLPTELTSNANTQILNQDILDFEPAAPIHVALLLWSAFYEFNPEEKAELLSRVYRMLVPGGFLVIDLPREFFAEALSDKGEFQVHVYGGQQIFHHLISDEELDRLAKRLGFGSVEKRGYQTLGSVKQERALFILTKA
ncbi:class I SAM-dependent methyltransferase [bacterium]|nr:class I SAM-dependent methyltransferase [bacterium]